MAEDYTPSVNDKRPRLSNRQAIRMSYRRVAVGKGGLVQRPRGFIPGSLRLEEKHLLMGHSYNEKWLADF